MKKHNQTVNHNGHDGLNDSPQTPQIIIETADASTSLPTSNDMNEQEQPIQEQPVIIIERVEDPDDQTLTVVKPEQPPKHPNRKWVWLSVSIVLASIIIAGAIYANWYYHRYVNIGVPISRTLQENVEILQSSDSLSKKELRALRKKAGVYVTSDSILGVSMDFYELRGLRGEVVMEEPDTLDKSVIFYTRCADYGRNDLPIGSLVSKGELKCEDDSRLGYCGMVGSKTVIGVSRLDDVRRYCEEAGGSFFRQFILVSGGELPSRFHLHGKVERRALARTEDDRLFFVQTVYPEVMTAFADAMREYGFVDAIYIPGGNDYCYYRSRWGTRHDIGDIAQYPHQKAGIVPWLVFRKI